MHRNLFLLLLPAVACQTEANPRGPTPTTLAIIETEPVPPPPPLASVFEPVAASVEADGFEAASGSPADTDTGLMPRSIAIEVRAGENIVLLARWAGTDVETVAELNGLDVSEPLYPGQSLQLPTADETADAAMLETRQAFAQARLERYLERRGGLMAVEEHRVRTGETAWAIARDQHGIPTWVLSAYNPDTNLERLGIGERLLVPVLSDTVAEVGTAEEVRELMSEDVWGEVTTLGAMGEPGFDLTDELSPEDMPSASETVVLRFEAVPSDPEPLEEEPLDAP